MGQRVDNDHEAFWKCRGAAPGRTLEPVVDQRPSDEVITPRGADGWAEIWADGAGSDDGDDAWDTFLGGSDAEAAAEVDGDTGRRWRRRFARSA